MRVLHVNKYLHRRGGADAYCLGLADLQRNRGLQVDFFAMSDPDNEPSTYSEWFPRHAELSPPYGGAKHRVLTAGRMIYNAQAARGMSRVLDSFQPDVVHLHNIYHQLSPSILGPVRDRNIASVMTLHDYKLACPSYRMLDHGRVCDACINGGFRQAVRRKCKDDSFISSGLLAVESAIHRRLGSYDSVGLFICPSTFLRDTVARAGIDPGRLRVAANYVDVSGAVLKTSAGGPVLYSGRLSEEKGVDVLLGAAQRLPPGTTLRILGDGPARSELEAAAANSGGASVEFVGHVSPSSVRRHLAEASVLVIPSRWNENQPLTVLEAFAAGVPVVASEIGGLPEMIRPGVDGLLVQPNDPEQLAHALRTLMNAPEWALEMGRSGRRRAEEEFGPAQHLDRVRSLYESLLGGDACA